MSDRPYNTEEVCRWIHSFGHEIVVSRDGQILAANAAMQAVLGRALDEIVGKNFLELLPEEERARVQDAVSDFRSLGTPARLTFSVLGLRQDGWQVPWHVEATEIPVSDGRPVVVSHCFQLGEMRSADLANVLARASAAFLGEQDAEGIRRQVLRAVAGAGLWAGFYRLSGGHLEERCALSPAPATLEPQLAEAAIREDRPAFGGDGSLATCAYIAIPNEPDPPDVLVVSGPFALVESPVLALFSRHVAAAYANAKLVSDLYESFRGLQEARATVVAKERLAALGELSAVVAHEVRNPLGVLFNAVSALRRLIPQGSDAAALVNILGEESDRLNRLVGDLLDFAKPRTLSLEPESVAGLIADSIEVARADPSAPAVRFESSVEPGLPDALLDRRLMRQALVNVELNACQAMPRGGTVRVRALREVRGGRPLLRIDVANDGPGISQEIAPRIFEPFFTTKASGTGLGLAVVKRIAEDHRGSVEVTSAPGEGTTFTFRLPWSPGKDEGAR